jgi:hypothetical protein
MFVGKQRRYLGVDEKILFKSILSEIGCGGVEWIEVAYGKSNVSTL